VTDKLAYADIYSALAAVERALGRTINPTVFTRAEWKKKRTPHDSFAARIATQPRLFVIGVMMARSDALESSRARDF
jgi:hypothetical protein